MAWSTIREATSEDYAALNKAARRFADHHNLDVTNFESGNNWYYRVDMTISSYVWQHRDPNDVEHWDAARLANLWRRVVRRALKEPSADGIAYNYVGSRVN